MVYLFHVPKGRRPSWNLKKYFYYLRPILAADYVLREGRNPSVAFAELEERIKNVAVSNALDELIAHKATVGESHRAYRSRRTLSEVDRLLAGSPAFRPASEASSPVGTTSQITPDEVRGDHIDLPYAAATTTAVTITSATTTALRPTPTMIISNQLLNCRSGSHAYGLATKTSDEDFRGVFYAAKNDFYAGTATEQIADATNDQVYYELGRFVELLTKANPTVLELLASPPEAILYRHPIMNHLRIEDFLTKACKNTFAGYATNQIRKARGLNKKVHNPMPKERKTVEHFCYILTEGKSLSFLTWLSKSSFASRDLALVRIDHTRGVYAIYYDPTSTWAEGISSGPNANDVCLSSVPKGQTCLAYLSFNHDGYSAYCRKHREYWQWVEDRNDVRYLSTLNHGQGYDAKNMMHTIRLLDMAIEVFRDGQLNVLRPDRAFLLEVKAGNFSLEEVLKMAETRLEELGRYAASSSLPERVDDSKVRLTLVKMRAELYG
jgi:predicted nucleotidyltransferase